MRWIPPLVISALLACPPVLAAEALRLGVVAQHDESLGDFDTVERYRMLSRQLSAKLKSPVTLATVSDTFTAVKRVTRHEYDLVLAPAHVIAAALRASFVPIAKTEEKSSAVFVVGANNKAQNLSDIGRVRLGMPAADSLQYGLARGELNRKSIEPRKRFSEVHLYRDQDVALYAIQIGSIDVAVADADLAREWVKKSGGHIIQTTVDVPALGLALDPARISAETGEKILAVLREMNFRRADGRPLNFVSAQRQEFAALSSTLNTTPVELPGARVIGAKEAVQLKDSGALVVDARNSEEYFAGRIKGATWIPYVEVSAKEVGFDPTEDTFDVSKLPPNKNAPIVLYCDGTPCWKSYKAATVAIAKGYRNIHWFRGGFPEWKTAGLPIDTGERK